MLLLTTIQAYPSQLYILSLEMAATAAPQSLVPHQLSLPGGKTLPPSIPLIISSQDNWNPLSCQLETGKQDLNNNTLKLVDDAIELLRSINKPLAVLSICGLHRSGKSYFISRALGSPGAFKLGHSMQACTRGIWMATTVLECPEFTTVLLDTEGIDAVGASETMAMSLLTLTTLLSSFLIYNSKKVPQKVDLDKMRCFSQLSTSLLAQCGESMSMDARKAFFPHFLWVLRDVNLKMTDREGKELSPTEFLHTRVLASESGELTDLGKSLVNLFPSLECATLPPPSINAKVLRDICNQQEKLNTKFNDGVSTLIQQILQKVAPKKAIDGTTAVNGKALAALAGGYVEAVNKPGTLPDLDQGWQAVVRLELKECSYKLAREYEREMEEALEGNLPMEERNLLRIHQQTLKRKKSALKEEIRRVNPLHSSDEEAQPFLEQLEEEVVQWSEPSKDGEREVTGGALYQFIVKNNKASKEHCEKLFEDLVKESKVQEKIDNAVKKSVCLNVQNEVRCITEKYNRMAVGPAASEVLERGLSELSQLSDILKKIPGKPRNIKVIGTGSDRLKLSWDPPEHNPEAAEEYLVYKKAQGGDWEEAARTEKTRVLVKELESCTKYEMCVLATNSHIKGLARRRENLMTKASAADGAAHGALACLPGVSVMLMAAGKLNNIPQSNRRNVTKQDILSLDRSRRIRMALRGAAMTPFSLLTLPITGPFVPVIAVVSAVGAAGSKTGDLTEA